MQGLLAMTTLFKNSTFHFQFSMKVFGIDNCSLNIESISGGLL